MIVVACMYVLSVKLSGRHRVLNPRPLEQKNRRKPQKSRGIVGRVAFSFCSIGIYLAVCRYTAPQSKKVRNLGEKTCMYVVHHFHCVRRT